MQLYAINDDFDLIHIFYFTMRKISSIQSEFWIKIYESDDDECSALVKSEESFSLVGKVKDLSEKKMFFCEYSEM